MPANRLLQAIALDKTTNMSDILLVSINNVVLYGAIIETFNLNCGTTPDMLVFTIRHPEITSGTGFDRIDNRELTVIGNDSCKFAPTTKADEDGRRTATEVQLSSTSGGAILWRGFITQRSLLPGMNAIQYVCNDIRCMMRDNIAGAFTELDGDGASGAFTHDRLVFNPNGQPNKRLLLIPPRFSYFTGDSSQSEPWNGASIIEYLCNLRDKQAVAWGIAQEGYAASAFKYALDGTLLLDSTTLTAPINPLLQSDVDNLGAFIRGGTDNLDYSGLSFWGAIEHTLKLYGYTLATGTGGVLQAVPATLNAVNYFNPEVIDIGLLGDVGIKTITNWSNSYAMCSNVPLPTAIETTDELEPAWTPAEEANFNSIYQSSGGTIADQFVLGALTKALEAEPRVFSSYRLPNKRPILDHISQVDPNSGELSTAIQLWVRNSVDSTWLREEIEGAGVYIDTDRVSIVFTLLPYTTHNLLISGNTITGRRVQATISFENQYGDAVKSTILASTPDAPIDPNLTQQVTMGVGSIDADDALRERFATLKDTPPLVPVFNMSNKRKTTTGDEGATPLSPADLGQIEAPPSLWKTNSKTASEYATTNPQIGVEIQTLGDSNQLSAARRMSAHLPKEEARANVSKGGLAIKCGMTCVRKVSGTGKDVIITFLASSVSHNFNGSEHETDIPVDVIISTDISMG